MKLKELNNKFPYLAQYNDKEWYTRIFKSSTDTDCETICNLQFGDLHSRFEDVDSVYNMNYIAFLNGLDDVMYYYMRLCEDKFNPYANVHEETTETTDNPYTKQIVTNGERVDESDPVTDTNTSGQGKSTNKAYAVANNTTEKKQTGESESVTDSRVDTMSIGKRKTTTGEQTNTLENEANTVEFTRTREGNIGVTTNGQLFEDTVKVATRMKIIELFLNEYVNYFSDGWWE